MKLKSKEGGIFHCLCKVFFVMRITLFFILLSTAFAFSANSYSQNTKLSLHLSNATVSDVLKAIEEKSEFIFFYQDQQIDLNRQVDIVVVDKTINEILDQLFKETGNKYKIRNRQIIIGESQKRLENEDLPEERIFEKQLPQSPKKEIKGRVTDSKGASIPGATIMIKETKLGTITNIDGTFSLEVPESSKILTISFIGYRTLEMEIGNISVFNIALEETNVGLDEVVVVGYGQQKKESVVGSITNTTGAALERAGGLSNLTSALSGQMPGVMTLQQTGEPGAEDVQIIIRAQTSWNGSDPLILVDGIERKMSDVDVSEVESVSVLKDASATAVFGVKGGNGVVLITTKRGVAGKPKVTFSGNMGMKFLSRTLDVMDSYDMLTYENRGIERTVVNNEGAWSQYNPDNLVDRYRRPQSPTDAYLFPNVDWKNVVVKDVAWTQKAGFTVTGGTDFAKYFGALTYDHEDDIFATHNNKERGYDPGYDYDRFNFRSNFDFKLTKSTTFSANLSGYIGFKKSANTKTLQLYSGLYGQPPNKFPVTYPDGTYGRDPFDEWLYNPVANMNNSGLKRENRTNINSDFTLKQNLDVITKGLSVQGKYAFDSFMLSAGGDILDGQFRSKYINGEKVLAGMTEEEATTYMPVTGIRYYNYVVAPWTITQEASNDDQDNLIARNTDYQLSLNYGRTFGKHETSGLLLFKRIQRAVGDVFPSRQEDWVGRVTYAFDSKYLAEFNGSYNGTDKFGPGYRFGFFPSMAVGWMLSDESFLKDYTWLNKLKVRYSWGQVGSDYGSDRWAFEDLWNTMGGDVKGGYGSVSSRPYPFYQQQIIGNPNVRWETSTKQNLGLEFSVLDNQLAANIDLWTEHRTDIFMSGNSRTVPSTFGASPVSANIGETKAKGFEVEVKMNKNFGHDLHLWSTISYTKAIDEVIFREDPALYEAYRKQAGFQIGQTKAMMHTGFINNWDDVYGSPNTDLLANEKLPGDLSLLDYNGDGLISDKDNAPFGYPDRPQSTYGWSLGVDYKHWSVMAQFYGVFNTSRVVTTGQYQENFDIVYQNQINHWWPGVDSPTDYGPRPNAYGYRGTLPIIDGSYLRLKNVEIAYTLDGVFVKRFGLSSLKVFVNGNNLLFWSDLPSDTEKGYIQRYQEYPTYRKVNFGLNLNF